MKIIIIIVVDFILDIVLSLYIPTTSYFLPLLTITNIYLLYEPKKKKIIF